MVGLCWLLPHCSPAPGTRETSPTDSGIDAPRASASSYGASPCGRCVAAACAGAVADCDSDPDCAAYLTCVDGCKVEASGDVDPSCKAACPTGSSSSGAQAEIELAACRTGGAGALCTSCGTRASKSSIFGEMCPPSGATDACDRCNDEHCCEVFAACDAACHGFIECMIDGGDDLDGGYLACEAQFPGGFVAAEVEHACTSIFCAPRDLCAVTTDPCFQCIFQDCGAQYASLVGSVQGALSWECSFAGNPVPDCIKLYPEASVLTEDLNACISNLCTDCF